MSDTGATYEILGKLATGGMAELFLARDGRSGEVRVLKRMLPHLGDDAEFVRMFRDEARLARRLHHPNIVRAIDIGACDAHFFTMEHVHGEDLRAIVEAARTRQENIPLPHILTIVLGLTAALHHTHEQTDEAGRPLHIVHRDVSPTNVLVGYDGRTKLLDFGVAKANAGTHVTRAGTLKGKLAYMSPEQCRADDIDRRSDVFAVGILLYELTTLTRLFAGNNDIAVLHKVMQGVTTPPSALRRGYPPALEHIVLGALQTDPAARYPTALALHDDLARFGEAVGIRPSEEALSRYLVGLFCVRPLPWQDPTRLDLGRALAAKEHQRTVVHPQPMSAQECTEVVTAAGPSAMLSTLPMAPTLSTTRVSPSPAPPRWRHLLVGALAVLILGLGVTAALQVTSTDGAGAAAAPSREGPAPPREVEPLAAPAPVAPVAPVAPTPPTQPAAVVLPPEDPALEIPPEFTRPPESEAPKPEFVLEKIEGEGNRRTATIQLQDGSTVRVELGASVADYRVVAVNEASVLLERIDGESRVTKRLDL